MEGGAILSVIVYFNQKSLLVVYRYRCHCFGGFQQLLFTFPFSDCVSTPCTRLPWKHDLNMQSCITQYLKAVRVYFGSGVLDLLKNV